MATLTTHSQFPEASRDAAYTRSYRTIRLVVGFLGILLPLIFILGEALFLKGGVHVRGSLSAYYHSPMQDIFVAGLSVIGFLLATYMAGEVRSWDFWVSLVAGIAVLGVVFFPTNRSGLAKGAPLCGSSPQPPSCSFVEQALGEHQTAIIHAVCAITFILGLAVMSLLFGLSEVRTAGERANATGKPAPGRFRNPVLFYLHCGCAVVIVTAGIWAFWGAGIGQLTPLYIGEVAAVWSFGLSWLVAGFNLTAPNRHEPAVAASEGPQPVVSAV